jgi:hypothetical protein
MKILINKSDIAGMKIYFSDERDASFGEELYFKTFKGLNEKLSLMFPRSMSVIDKLPDKMSVIDKLAVMDAKIDRILAIIEK